VAFARLEDFYPQGLDRLGAVGLALVLPWYTPIGENLEFNDFFETTKGLRDFHTEGLNRNESVSRGREGGEDGEKEDLHLVRKPCVTLGISRQGLRKK